MLKLWSLIADLDRESLLEKYYTQEELRGSVAVRVMKSGSPPYVTWGGTSGKISRGLDQLINSPTKVNMQGIHIMHTSNYFIERWPHLSLGTWYWLIVSSIAASCFHSKTLCRVMTASFIFLRILFSSSISSLWRSFWEDVRLTASANWAVVAQREEASHLLWPSCLLVSSLLDLSANTKLCFFISKNWGLQRGQKI